MFGIGLLCAAPIVPNAEPPGDPGQVFVLQDYRWVPVTVKRPTLVDCHFEVLNGSPTVHVELLSDDQFVRFARHRRYETLASTADGSSGSFARMIEAPGSYRVLIRNDQGAPPIAVSVDLKMDVERDAGLMTSGVPIQRRITVIAISLAVFFGTVFWSGQKLLRAYRHR